ncbi:MAG: sulfurtransferase TusA family protein [Deltaproteobacteria bacterium]|nr:sulfurtransferase TusA family protein [Deltaproteobacteria bacterium]
MLDADEILDLTGVPCPRNSARALLRLEMMDGGQILRVTVDDGEPIENVPGSLEAEGHTIAEREQLADSRWVLSVRVA